ncbi:MAG: DUF4365 domain-containing protein [Phycisphaerales bacterium]|nr:MAG: DUF4365 domain-containing protein [Phycisphaerales bacterium]
MDESFEYDVFLSYSPEDKRVVRALAERLKADGLNVTWDEGKLQQARTLILCMSPAYFASEWGTLEHHTVLFRDPTNARRRFIPPLVADWGIDGEIEFKDAKGRASGQRVYLQLKSGDSYLYHRQRDDVEVFTIRNPRHAEYWLSQAYPVMLVIRTSDGKIRWMNVTEYLERHGADTKQVVLEGEAFTAANVVKLRSKVLGEE